MVNGVILTMLAVESVSDIRTQTVSVIRIGIYAVIGIILNVFLRYQTMLSLMGGVLIGVILLGYAVLTKENIGYGDAMIFIVSGIITGLSSNLHLLFFSLLMASVTGGIYALVEKKSIKTRIPYVPCIFVTYLIMSLMEAAA